MSADQTKIKARLPRGFSDRAATDIRATEAMVATIRQVYERYGFEPVETPFAEYTEALGKFLPDQDRPNEGVFSFQDESPQEARSGGAATGKEGEWISLRYDLTAPLARYYAEHQRELPKPYRSYRFGWVFRNEKPGPGRFRQFMQFDADTVGAASPAADAEMCMMAADTMEALGIPRGQYVIKVNSRKVLDGVMEAIGVTDERQKLTVLRAIDKLDRLGVEGVRQLLGEGRKDDSGDFTKGAGLPESESQSIIDVLALSQSAANAYRGSSSVDTSRVDDQYLSDRRAKITFELIESLNASHSIQSSTAKELQEIWSTVKAAGYDDGRVWIDPSVVRGLEYYTGAVFEAELLAEIPNEKGQPVVFGSVGGGGRYDGLVGRFQKEDVPATGFSLGVSRLQAALAALGQIDTKPAPGPVVVTVMDRDRLGDYQRMVSTLRSKDIAAELYLGSSGVRAQLKYADKRNAPAVVIQGDQERDRGVVQIKDLALGKQLAEAVADNREWREERPGQFEVAEDEMIDAIRRIVDADG
ncbi:histidine--tRNA ligase [Bauldia sp.]|uniref:histidine--tRNA ligase n=1 Tax=Bauldia sp. TaxID=2575872 RepID=UPI003BAAF982